MLPDCDPSLKAVALSRFDRADLKALYAMTDRDTPTHLQKGDIAYLMREYLSRDD